MVFRAHNPNCPRGPHAVCPPPPNNLRRIPFDPGRPDRPDPRDGGSRDRPGAGGPERPVQAPPINGNGTGDGDNVGAVRPVPPTVDTGPKGPPEVTTLSVLQEVLQELRDLRETTIQIPLPEERRAEIRVQVVLVETAGTPVQAPEIPVPKGVSVIIRQRHHGSNRTGYVSFEGRSGTSNQLGRLELQDNDAVTVPLSSLDDIWFDATVNNTYFEIIFQQSRRPQGGIG